MSTDQPDGTETLPAIWARRVTLSGHPDALDDRKVTIAASLFTHFSQQAGHLGGHLLVQRDFGRFCATSFWELPSLERTMNSVQSAAKQMSETIWGSSGRWDVEVFEVIGLKPAVRPVAIPHL